jgi:hypothetical protein
MVSVFRYKSDMYNEGAYFAGFLSTSSCLFPSFGTRARSSSSKMVYAFLVITPQWLKPLSRQNNIGPFRIKLPIQTFRNSGPNGTCAGGLSRRTDAMPGMTVTKACSGGRDRDAWAEGKIRLARAMPGNMPRQLHSRRDFFGAGSWFRSSQNRQLLPGAKPSKRRCKTQSILPPYASIQCEQRLALMTKVTKCHGCDFQACAHFDRRGIASL